MNINPHHVQWYVVYTRPKLEKKVASSISEMGIESYLPTYTVVRQWSDRKKKIEVPLFPNYVFVRILPVLRLSLYSIKEIVQFVSIEKRPVIVRDKDIDAIQSVLKIKDDVLPEQYFVVGDTVRICAGAFAGLEGVVVKRNNKARMIIRIEGIMKAFSFNAPDNLAEIVTSKQELVTCDH